MLGHQLVMRDVDDQIALSEHFDRGGRHSGDQLVGTGRDGGLVDENTRAEVLFTDVDTEVSHGLDTDGGLVAELNPQGAHLGELLSSLGRGSCSEAHQLSLWFAHGTNLGLELFQRHVDFFIGDEVALVSDHLLDGSERSVQTGSGSFNVLHVVYSTCCLSTQSEENNSSSQKFLERGTTTICALQPKHKK